MVHFQSWAKKNLKEGDTVVVEVTGSVWGIYDIVDPLVTRTVVANAHKVRQIAEARVKTDKEDIKRLICSCLRSSSISPVSRETPSRSRRPFVVREINQKDAQMSAFFE